MFNTLLKFIGLSGLWILVISCTDEPTNPQIDYSDILKTETNEVIILTYNDLNEKASLLSSRINEFSANKTQAHLDLIRQLWRDARKPWEQAEGFLFGPVDLQGIDPSIDSWPVNVIDLDAVLASNDPLTKDYLDGLEGTLKGFHTLEYLLFGINGNKTIQEFTDRQIEYLTACAHSLQGETNKLFTSWINGPNPYGEILKTAGDSSNQVYLSQKSALQELSNKDQHDLMTTLYKNRDVEGLYDLISRSSEMKDHRDLFLHQRNKNWVNQLPDILKEVPSFIAVGAGHLGGPQGVIALLRAKGFTVEPVL